MTAATWWLLALMAVTGVLTVLAVVPSDRKLERRPLPLPERRPDWATDPRILGVYPHAAQHAEHRAPLLTYFWELD